MPATRTRPSTRFKNLSEDLEAVNSNSNPNSTNLHQQSPGTQGVVGAKSRGKKLNFKCTYLKCCRSFISNKELQAHKEEVHYMKPIVCPYPLCPVTCKKPSKNFDHHIASHGPPETWKLDQIVKEVQTEVEEDGRGNPRMQVHHEEFQDDLPPLSLSPFQNHLLSRESFSSSGSSPSSSSAASSSAASGMTSSSSQSTEFDFMSPASSSSAPRPSILNRPFMNSYASLQQSCMNQDPSLDQENYYNQSHLGLKPAAKINENFSHQNPHHDFNYQSLDFDFSSSKGLIYHHRQDSMSSNQGSGHLNWHQHQQQYQYQTPPQTNVNSHYPSRVNYSYENNGTLGLKGADEEAEQSFGFRS